MSRKQARRTLASLAAGCAVLGGALTAAAQTKPTCDSLVSDGTLPNPIYGNGGSAVTADLGTVAVALSQLTTPINVLYSDAGGACAQLQTFVDGNVASDFHYFTATTGPKGALCTAPLGGIATSFAHLGNPADACTTVTLPSDVKEFPAPVQTLNIITPSTSSEVSISADALYVAYGFGTLAPWTNTAHLAKRSATSFASLLLSAAIGVPGGAFKGDVTYSTQPDVINAINTFKTDNANDPIGYVSGSAADATRGTANEVKTLAFQAKGQTCGFWPDSKPNTLDKINVRTGQYELWTPGHFYTKVDGSGKPVNQTVADLLDWYAGKIGSVPPVDVTGLVIDSGDIPLCAMQVTRSGLLGPVSSWQPPQGCTHFFEKRATGSTTGTPCTVVADCAGVANEHLCNYGYCEAY